MRSLFGYLALVLLSGCYYDNEEELYPFSFCDTSNVTWTNSIEPLMQTRCAVPGCHVPGAQSPDLSTYAKVKSQADAGRLRARVIDGSPSYMPPSGKLPACEQEKLNIWLEMDSPNNL